MVLHFGKVWLDGRTEPKIFSREEVEGAGLGSLCRKYCL